MSDINFTSAHKYFRSRTGQLALTYLAIIMTMTLLFSGVIFLSASRQFDRPLEGRGGGRVMMLAPDDLRTMLETRAAEAREELFWNLFFLNLVALGFGLWFSTYLAARTMAPIERAMDEQAQFVSDASHEIRTPLTALGSLNEVFLRRKNKITDAEARELATQNVAETRKLYELTTSLLGLVHAERQPAVMMPVDLQRAVSDAMEHVITAAQAKSITVDDTTPSVAVTSHAERLTQVVKVLLENAVKYSHKQGVVRIYAVTHGDRLTLHVADDGIGIAKGDVPHIFNRFYRADQSRSKQAHDGYGIGLAIAKAISDQIGMNIHVDSRVGKGSDFSIDLPLAKEE